MSRVFSLGGFAAGRLPLLSLPCGYGGVVTIDSPQKEESEGINTESFFRVIHSSRGAGIVLMVEGWSPTSQLYHVEFDSGVSALVFSSACKPED